MIPQNLVLHTEPVLRGARSPLEQRKSGLLIQVSLTVFQNNYGYGMGLFAYHS
jgi:hypothetical protein